MLASVKIALLKLVYHRTVPQVCNIPYGTLRGFPCAISLLKNCLFQ